MGRRTGRPRGRPPKLGHEKAAQVAEKQQAAVNKPVEILFGLTEADVAKITPKRFFQLALQDAMRRSDLVMAREAAKDWAPYEHARPVAAQPLTPEELRRIADLARSEADRRGPVVPPAGRPDLRALPH